MSEFTFDDNPLLFDNNNKASEFLRQYQKLRRSDQSLPETAFDGRNSSTSNTLVGLPTPNYPPMPELGINQLYWPTGATRWGRIYCLASDRVAGIIQNLAAEGEAKTLRVSFDIEQEFEMFALPPIKISAMEGELGPVITKAEPMWLCPLVDARYTWQYRDSGAITKAVELLTWTALFTHLATRLGYTFGTDFDLNTTPDADYLKPHQIEFLRPYENAARMLDAAAHSTGRRVMFYQDGQVQITDSDQAEDNYEINIEGPTPATPWCRIAGGAIEPEMIAEKTVVTFPKGCNLRYAIEKSTVTTAGTISGTYKTIHSAAYPDFKDRADATPSNNTELDALSVIVGIDWAAWEDRRYDHTYAGLKEWRPVGYDDHILYDFDTQQKVELNVSVTDSGEGELSTVVKEFTMPLMTTRVVCVPFNFGIAEQLQGSALDRLGGNTIAKTTSVISAATESGGNRTPGSGFADFYESDGDDSILSTWRTAVRVLNYCTTDVIPTGTWIGIVEMGNCDLYAFSECCIDTGS